MKLITKVITLQAIVPFNNMSWGTVLLTFKPCKTTHNFLKTFTTTFFQVQTNLISSSSQIQAKILLRFNTIFKQIRPNFFSLLDNGRLLWGFDIISKQADAQTFAIVIQNTLTSLKGLYYAENISMLARNYSSSNVTRFSNFFPRSSQIRLDNPICSKLLQHLEPERFYDQIDLNYQFT